MRVVRTHASMDTKNEQDDWQTVKRAYEHTRWVHSHVRIAHVVIVIELVPIPDRHFDIQKDISVLESLAVRAISKKEAR